jgi:hypothetical protein
METDPTASAASSDPAPVASARATMTVAEPAAPPEPPPHGFDRIKQMVENGIAAVEAGFKVGENEFHKQGGDIGVLDHHGFKAWRAAHSEGCDPAELDAVEAKAVVDPDVETAEAKAVREAKERAEETPEAKAVREAWEAETGNTTHFASVTPDGSPAAAQGAGVQAVAEPSAPAPSAGEPVA